VFLRKEQRGEAGPGPRTGRLPREVP
jgi:hypothetical protein